ncbi:MAG: hypothetical protein IPJ61_18695 [Tessaracoccus sp.]|uniref:hypothetical protein n=1 Tax=Tessaracoccus sp. TaxID=1971211 RepID=UPI001EC00820|nr:hypothetical protein [Tessaracoccus sp.]MBK7823014.1 hypothetical protein [Tessaracoccus sp.]
MLQPAESTFEVLTTLTQTIDAVRLPTADDVERVYALYHAAPVCVPQHTITPAFWPTVQAAAADARRAIAEFQQRASL